MILYIIMCILERCLSKMYYYITDISDHISLSLKVRFVSFRSLFRGHGVFFFLSIQRRRRC